MNHGAKVVWTRQATDDLYAVYEFLSAYSDKQAESVTDEIINRVFLLEKFPQLGRVVPELNIETIRELVVRQYRIIYSFAGNEQVEILAIRHSSRPLSEI